MNCARVRAHLGDHLEGDLDLHSRVRVDSHLAACTGCSEELRELRATVALVRSLPTPESEPGVVDAVMRRIDAGEGRIARLPELARRAFDPRLAAPLAAGIAALVVLASVDNGPTGDQALVAGTGGAVDSHAEMLWNGVRRPVTTRRRIGPRLLGIERTAAKRFYQPNPQAAMVGFFGRADPDVQQLDLDAQLDRVKLDPAEFLERVNQIDEIERHPKIAPLVALAEHRGEAEVVAAYLRSIPHPLAASMAAQFERGQPRGRNHRARANPVAVPASYR